MIPFRSFLSFFLDNFPEIADCLVRHILAVFDRLILILVNQIRLHRLIFFIINIKPSRTSECASLIRIEAFLSLLPVHTKQCFVVPAKMIQMCFDHLFVQILFVARQGKRPAKNLLMPEIFFHHIVNLRPHAIIKNQMIRRRLHSMNGGCTAYKEVRNPIRPLKLTEQNRHASLRCRKIFFQKSFDIVFQINSFSSVCITNLTDVFRHMKAPFISVCLLLVFFINNLNHTFHPFLPNVSLFFREKDRFWAMAL